MPHGFVRSTWLVRFRIDFFFAFSDIVQIMRTCESIVYFSRKTNIHTHTHMYGWMDNGRRLTHTLIAYFVYKQKLAGHMERSLRQNERQK